MIRAWMVLRKHWEYDDSFYNFVGHDGVEAVCFARAHVELRVRAATARFVRDYAWSLSRYEHGGIDEARADAAETMNDEEACALAREMNLEPFTIQEVEITHEFLNTSGLSAGKRTALLRKLGEKIRPLSPEAADHLESHEE